jgi:hypothetical protein
MTQCFSGIVPALKEEITLLKSKNTDLEKKAKLLEDDNRKLRLQMAEQTTRNEAIAEKLALNG